MALSYAQLASFFDQGYSFIELLNYIDYQDDVYYLADGSLGKIYEIKPINTEATSEDFLLSAAKTIEQFIVRLNDERLACQFIVRVKTHDVNLDEYRKYRENSNDFDLFMNSKLNHLGPLSKEIRIFFTIRYFPKWNKSCSFKNESEMKALMQDHLNEFGKLIISLEQVFSYIHIDGKHVESKELIQWLYQVLNPKRKSIIPDISLSEDIPIREQVLFNAPVIDGNGIRFEDQHMRVISIKELPSETEPGMFSRELIEGVRFCLLDSVPEMIIAVNFTIPSISKSTNQLKWRKSFAFMHQHNWLGDKAIEVIEKKKEVDLALEKVITGNERIVQMRFHAIICHTNLRDIEISTETFINSMSRLHCEAFVENIIGASLFITCLPLGFDPYFEDFIKRDRTLSSVNLVDMFPLYGSFQGTKTPAATYLNRRGQMVWLDLFDSNINPHAVVIGASGAGKSFFMNDFILQHKRLGAYFFVLDKGDSYRKINELLDGQYIKFDLNNPITINPFKHEPTPENLSFLQSLLSQMASGGDERSRLNREEEGLMQKAISYLYDHVEGEIVLSDLVRILNSSEFNDKHGINSIMGPTLALRLTPFTRKGPYGGFFDGANQFDIKGSFTVFELANLSSYSDLQVVVLLNLMFFMTNFVSDPTMKPLRKYLLIDEAWSLLKVKNTADFITNAFKTFRKYRCSVTAITQELADLLNQESGVAIIANTANKVFLKQEAILIDLLRDRLSLDSPTINVLKTIETIKGKYAEAFVIAESNKGVIRLYADPLLYWAANSQAKDNDYLKSKVDFYQGNLLKAVEACAKEYPYGLA